MREFVAAALLRAGDRPRAGRGTRWRALPVCRPAGGDRRPLRGRIDPPLSIPIDFFQSDMAIRTVAPSAGGAP